MIRFFKRFSLPVSLFVITFAIFYHDTCVGVFCQDRFLEFHIPGHHTHACRPSRNTGICIRLIDSTDRIDRNIDRRTDIPQEVKSSARQISGRLALEGKYISHETIYKMIRGDKANGGTLYKNCRHHLKHRRRPVGEARIKIPNRTSIHERPKEADGRRFGDLEMDTLVGKTIKEQL